MILKQNKNINNGKYTKVPQKHNSTIIHIFMLMDYLLQSA
jgi:hypothetical protein